MTDKVFGWDLISYQDELDWGGIRAEAYFVGI